MFRDRERERERTKQGTSRERETRVTLALAFFKKKLGFIYKLGYEAYELNQKRRKLKRKNNKAASNT